MKVLFGSFRAWFLKGKPYKGLLDARECILRFDWFDLSADLNDDSKIEDTDFVHVSYANKNSWECSFFGAFVDPDPLHQQIAERFGNLAILCCWENREDMQVPLTPENVFTRLAYSSVPYFLRDDEHVTSHKVTVTLYTLVGGSRELLQMTLCEQEIKQVSSRMALAWPPVRVRQKQAVPKQCLQPPVDGRPSGASRARPSGASKPVGRCTAAPVVAMPLADGPNNDDPDGIAADPELALGEDGRQEEDDGWVLEHALEDVFKQLEDEHEPQDYVFVLLCFVTNRHAIFYGRCVFRKIPRHQISPVVQILFMTFQMFLTFQTFLPTMAPSL